MHVYCVLGFSKFRTALVESVSRTGVRTCEVRLEHTGCFLDPQAKNLRALEYIGTLASDLPFQVRIGKARRCKARKACPAVRAPS